VFLTTLAWILNIWVVLTYLMMVRGRWSEFRFDLANALGFIPTALINVLAGVYPPLVLTISFGLIGAYGATQELWRRYGPEALEDVPAWGPLYFLDEIADVPDSVWDDHDAHVRAYNEFRNIRFGEDHQ
jgi:hypothetical protein